MLAVNSDIPEDTQLLQKEQELVFARECLARFTYAISHELVSPVSTLSRLMEIFCNENRERLDATGNELLDMIMLSATRTQETVSGIFEYSASARLSRETQSVDSRALIDEVLLEMDPVVKNSKAVIDIGDMPILNSSEDGLRHVFRQLVSNALKFNLEDDPPKLSISAIQEQNGVEFIVSDNGIGIETEHQESIFELFSRLYTQAEFNGVGLGLPIALQIVQALDGRMWVTQGEHRGSAFHVYLPGLD